MPDFGTFSQTLPTSALFPFENAPIIRPSICLDAVSMASAYPNWATIANAAVTTAAPGLTNPLRGLTQGGLVIRSVNNSVNSTFNQNAGSGSGAANGCIISAGSQVFSISTEANIPITKTFTSIGSFPTTLSSGSYQILQALGFYSPVSGLYYFLLQFGDISTFGQGTWFFSINPANAATSLIYSGSPSGFFGQGYPFAGDGTNFVGAGGSYLSSYYNASGTAVGSLPTAQSRYTSQSGSLVQVPSNNLPLIVGNTKIWTASLIYEGGGNNSILLRGVPKWAGGAPVIAYKLVGKGTGVLQIPTPGYGGPNTNGAIIASATAQAAALLILDTDKNYQLFDVAA